MENVPCPEDPVKCPQCRSDMLDFQMLQQTTDDGKDKFCTEYTCENCGHKWQVEQILEE
jgi:DNA-directed RNA polymerase subunit M/transcription elongation factor TFIIS